MRKTLVYLITAALMTAKALADAAQPLYASLNEQQKSRFAETLFGDNCRTDRTSDWAKMLCVVKPPQCS